MARDPAAPLHTRNSLSAEARRGIVAVLDQLLADLLDLRSQIKHAHWNVRGPGFQEWHELFDELAGDVDALADTVAERATALGGVAHGFAKAVADRSRLGGYPADVAEGAVHAADLADRFASCANAARAQIRPAAEVGDDATADVFTEVTRELDKRLWFLEAHLHPRG